MAWRSVSPPPLAKINTKPPNLAAEANFGGRSQLKFEAFRAMPLKCPTLASLSTICSIVASGARR